MEFATETSALERENRAAYEVVIARRDEVIAAHAARKALSDGVDPLERLKDRLKGTLAAGYGVSESDIVIDPVERERFDADLAFKFPSLLKDGGPKRFATEHAPRIKDLLAAPDLADVVASVEAVGMYLNVRLQDGWFLVAACAVVEAGESFGRSSPLIDERFVVDYSSPNVAKSLHAGHIRSTIIGTVLSNLLAEAGGLVFRVNHINDFGGFGFLLEGQRQFATAFPPDASLNDKSLEIYRLRRILERASAGGEALDLSPEDMSLLHRLLPDVSDRETAAAALARLTAAADRRFEALEAGDEAEVELWKAMVSASLAEFASFYSSLDVSIDFVIGESFYAPTGLALVKRWLESGQVVLYGQEEAEEDLRQLRASFQAEEISENELQSLEQAVAKDVGAVVVRLSPSERYVVLRADGRSIYATRDLAAVAMRGEIFDPTCFIYVVGQEQRTHFERLFAACYQLGLADRERTTFEHLYFGFYVDARTHRKLSSRESASGVTHLLEAAQAYFRSRVTRTGRQDLDTVARQLTIASIVFNDLKQDTKSTVEMDTKNVGSMVETFEKSGGAYVIYTACRAGSIVTKANAVLASGTGTVASEFEADEVRLLLHLLAFPAVVAGAAAQRNPSMLVRHMFTLSNLYNSYNARARVIGEEGVFESRLTITAAVEQTLRNGLRLCNVDCPDYI